MDPQSKKIRVESSIIAQVSTYSDQQKTRVSEEMKTQKDKICDVVTCHYYVPKKRRKCKVKAVKGKIYCAEHLVNISGEEISRKRMPCPLDPNHSCYEDSLEKHLKKCNARPELLPECYVKNINAGDSDGEDPKLYKVTIRKAPQEDVLKMVEICKRLHSEHIGEVKQEILFHRVMQKEAANPMNGDSAQKHIVQQASLIGHMDRMGLLQDHHCYAEFGAGKGGLSHWVQKAVEDNTDTQFVLIDKSSVRYKMDCFHKGREQGPSFQRIKLDIKDIDLGKAANFDNDRAIISIGKHLCGGATDLMLRCITKTFQQKEKHKSYVRGIALALCCHHQCDWTSYIGKSFMKQCGLSARQFHIMCCMTSWATCASQHVKVKEGVDAAEKKSETAENSYNHFRYGSLLPQEREIIGNQCKQLIDFGRLKYLQEHGFEAELIQYVEKESTLENVCLMAVKKHKDYEVKSGKSADNTS